VSGTYLTCPNSADSGPCQAQDEPVDSLPKLGTYIPFTSPGVLLLRLTLLDEWPWIEIIISLAILIVSIWIFMKLAGKIFKVGILMYGKNATPKEIWKWLRAH
jgi:ABC-2 type transport system permease protein